MTLLDRLRKLPLPAGTIPVGVGLGLAGLMQYGFLVVAARALGQAKFAPLSVFWALLFVCGPGFFLPLEQETGRAIAARRVRGEGGRPVVERATIIGTTLAVVLIIGTLALAGPIDNRVFDGDPALLAGLVGGFAAYLLEFLVRGVLAGNGRFGAYGILIGGEGLLRVVFAAFLAVIGVKVAGPYGVAMIVASFVAIALSPDRAARAAPSRASGALVGDLPRAWLPPDRVGVHPTAAQRRRGRGAAAGNTTTGERSRSIPAEPDRRVRARSTSSRRSSRHCCPGSPRSPRAARSREFRSLLFRLLTLVGALGVVAIVGFTLLGPTVTRLLFGHGFELSNLDFALLSASCIGFIVTQVFGYGLISLSGYRRVAVGWMVGGVVFIAVAAVGSQLFLRVELGLLCGAVASSAVMAALLLSLLRARDNLDTEPRKDGATVHPA